MVPEYLGAQNQCWWRGEPQSEATIPLRAVTMPIPTALQAFRTDWPSLSISRNACSSFRRVPWDSPTKCPSLSASGTSPTGP